MAIPTTSYLVCPPKKRGGNFGSHGWAGMLVVEMPRLPIPRIGMSKLPLGFALLRLVAPGFCADQFIKACDVAIRPITRVGSEILPLQDFLLPPSGSWFCSWILGTQNPLPHIAGRRGWVVSGRPLQLPVPLSSKRHL